MQTYDELVEKYEQKLTTDDCYTPPDVYDVVRDWAVQEFDLAGRPVVRPFWPGGNYETYDYPDGCVVIDNPPFSILTKIRKFYDSHSIDYFLFAPHLTLFDCGGNAIIVGFVLVYKNGAKIPTSFITSLGGNLIATAPELYAAMNEAQPSVSRAVTKREWPEHLLAAGMLNRFSRNGNRFTVKPNEAVFVRTVGGQRVFGSGYLLNSEKAAELQNLPSKTKTHTVELTAEEIALIAALDKAAP